MSLAARQLARPDAARVIVDRVFELLENGADAARGAGA
jgi:hypothetical protein